MVCLWSDLMIVLVKIVKELLGVLFEQHMLHRVASSHRFFGY